MSTLSKAYSNYGASMGRPSYHASDRTRVAEIRISRIVLRDDYDSGGAYWGGGGLPLFRAEGESSEGEMVDFFFRAADLTAAKALVISRHGYENARFSDAPDLAAVVDQYLTTALWSSTDNADESGGKPLDANYDVDDVAPESRAKAERDLRRFFEVNAAILSDPSCSDATQIGHDFWLTRNGHGCGFWDGDYPEAIGKALTEASKAFGECDAIIGDDGLIHLEGGK